MFGTSVHNSETRIMFAGAIRQSTLRLRSASVIAAAIAMVSISTALHAQGAYAGGWHVSAWKVAPWVPAAEQASIKPDKLVLDHDIVFAGSKITGPKIIACAGPKYEIKNVPFENLFEGGLKKPATEGPALGFKAPVRTLMPGCDMEFHSLNETSAMFALNNILYTMTKGVPAKPKPKP